ncbi:MAG: mechanosensitive ion channel family protein, partial [Myxococcales bacterium]|nr:mechanosensitive ion channel family protein [Myxococcales bacterium]
VRSRQYTGRIVSVSNARIFDDPVYNYTQDFAYVWEEMMIPVRFDCDRERVEQILLDAAGAHTARARDLSAHDLAALERRYFIRAGEVTPAVYFRITDNWLELTVRFLCPDHGIREIKDAMSRDILRDLDAAGIGIASATFEVVGVPPLELRTPAPAAQRRADHSAE